MILNLIKTTVIREYELTISLKVLTAPSGMILFTTGIGFRALMSAIVNYSLLLLGNVVRRCHQLLLYPSVFQHISFNPRYPSIPLDPLSGCCLFFSVSLLKSFCYVEKRFVLLVTLF